jgi:hypothetical protein
MPEFPRCPRCGEPMDDGALLMGGEVCTACGLAAKRPSGPPWPPKDHCMDCGAEVEFEPTFAGHNRCAHCAIAAGNVDPRRRPLSKPRENIRENIPEFFPAES